MQELVSWIWWLSVVSTLFYVVFFAVGPGSIPWMITAELFSQGPRPAAMSVAVLINWCANFVVAIGFPTMQVGPKKERDTLNFSFKGECHEIFTSFFFVNHLPLGPPP
jgi:hypothetical protein